MRPATSTDQTTWFWQLSPDRPHGGLTSVALLATSVVHDSESEPPAEPNPENPTSEAKCEHTVVTIQNESRVAVAANSGVAPPLDKRDNPPCGPQGRSSPDPSAPSPWEPGTPRLRVVAHCMRLKSVTAQHAKLARQIDNRSDCSDALPTDSSLECPNGFPSIILKSLLCQTICEHASDSPHTKRPSAHS